MECLSFYIGQQLFGIEVGQVQDVIGDYLLSPIPLAPPEVLGSLNLRGRIVTAVDVRRRLNLAEPEVTKQKVAIVVFYGDDIHSLIVDSIGDVISIDPDELQANPPTLGPRLSGHSKGVVRLEGALMVLLDTDKILDFGAKE